MSVVILLAASLASASVTNPVDRVVSEASVPVTNVVDTSWSAEVRRRLHGTVTVDYQNAFLLRGIVLSSSSTIVQTGNLYWDGGVLGRFGGTMLSVSCPDKSGCPIADRTWYTAAAYNVYYGYDFRLADAWTLETRAFRNWLTFVGCVGDKPTLCHWGGYLGLKNPYVTPFCTYRWADRSQHWSYWDLGLRKPIRPLDRLTLLPMLTFEFGDGRHLYEQYGQNPNSSNGRYSPGLMAMNLMLYAEYALTPWFSLTAFVREFITLNRDGRDALDRRKGNNTLKDMTVFGVGVKFSF